MNKIKEFLQRECWDVPMPLWVVCGLCWGFVLMLLAIFWGAR